MINLLPEKERRVFLSILVIQLIVSTFLIIICIVLMFNLSEIAFNEFIDSLHLTEHHIGDTCNIISNSNYLSFYQDNLSYSYELTLKDYFGDSVFLFEAKTPISIPPDALATIPDHTAFRSMQGIQVAFVNINDIYNDLPKREAIRKRNLLRKELKKDQLASYDTFIRFRDSEEFFCIRYDYRIISGPFQHGDPILLAYRVPLYMDELSEIAIYPKKQTDGPTLVQPLNGADFIRYFELGYDEKFKETTYKVAVSPDGCVIYKLIPNKEISIYGT